MPQVGQSDEAAARAGTSVEHIANGHFLPDLIKRPRVARKAPLRRPVAVVERERREADRAALDDAAQVDSVAPSVGRQPPLDWFGEAA